MKQRNDRKDENQGKLERAWPPALECREARASRPCRRRTCRGDERVLVVRPAGQVGGDEGGCRGCPRHRRHHAVAADR